MPGPRPSQSAFGIRHSAFPVAPPPHPNVGASVSEYPVSKYPVSEYPVSKYPVSEYPAWYLDPLSSAALRKENRPLLFFSQNPATNGFICINFVTQSAGIRYQ